MTKPVWVCMLKDYNLPVTVETEEKARELLNSWNEKRADGEATLSETVTESMSIDGKNIDITKIYLTLDDMDEEDPWGLAVLSNYGDTLSDINSISLPVKQKCFNPVFGLDQDLERTFYCLRIRRIAGNSSTSPFELANQLPGATSPSPRISIQILKETPNTDIAINSQKDLFDWIYANIPQETVIAEPTNDIRKYTTINQIKIKSTNIAMCTRRGPGNTAIIGKEIIDDIGHLLENKIDVLSYESDEFEYVGTFDGIDFFTPKDSTLIEDDMVIMTYTASFLDKGLFLLKDIETPNIYYLNLLEEKTTYLSSYKDFIRVFRIIK